MTLSNHRILFFSSWNVISVNLRAHIHIYKIVPIQACLSNIVAF